jgi:hypothetical protein
MSDQVQFISAAHYVQAQEVPQQGEPCFQVGGLANPDNVVTQRRVDMVSEEQRAGVTDMREIREKRI